MEPHDGSHIYAGEIVKRFHLMFGSGSLGKDESCCGCLSVFREELSHLGNRNFLVKILCGKVVQKYNSHRKWCCCQ